MLPADEHGSHRALKLRYNVPVWTPPAARADRLAPDGSSPSPGASPQSAQFRFPTAEPPLTFDAPLIARLEPGWADMLDALVVRWVRAVVEERRGDSGRA